MSHTHFDDTRSGEYNHNRHTDGFKPFAAQDISEETHYSPHMDPEAARTETQERIARRHRKRLKRETALRRRKRRLQIIGAAVIIFICLLLLRVLPIPFGTVVIDGNGTMPDEDVLRVGGIPSTVNVVRLSTSEIRERLLRDLRVGDVSVERELPATIHIFVKERKAVAVVRTLYGFAYIDDTGTVIGLEPQIKGVAVPIITGKKVDTLLLGDRLDDIPMKHAMAYLEELSPEISSQIAEINVGDPKELIAYTTDGLSIHLGNGDRTAERAAVTQGLLEEIRNNRLSVQYIDVNPDAPIIKEK